jgi:hypothetical protein
MVPLSRQLSGDVVVVVCMIKADILGKGKRRPSCVVWNNFNHGNLSDEELQIFGKAAHGGKQEVNERKATSSVEGRDLSLLL